MWCNVYPPSVVHHKFYPCWCERILLLWLRTPCAFDCVVDRPLPHWTPWLCHSISMRSDGRIWIEYIWAIARDGAQMDPMWWMHRQCLRFQWMDRLTGDTAHFGKSPSGEIGKKWIIYGMKWYLIVSFMSVHVWKVILRHLLAHPSYLESLLVMIYWIGIYRLCNSRCVQRSHQTILKRSHENPQKS